MSEVPDYAAFLARKSQLGGTHGFEPLWLPDCLFDFQRHLVDWALRKGRAAIFADCGLGKAERADQRILTPDGWVEIGSAKVGMQVYGSGGRPHDITGVYPQGVKRMARVTFTDGSSVVCDWNHLWYVQSQQQAYWGRPGRVLSTAQVVAKGLRFDGGQRKHFVPLVRPLSFPERSHLIDPYTLGVLLGDGCMTQGTYSVTCPDFGFTPEELPLPGGCRWSEKSTPDRCKAFSIVGGDFSHSENPLTTEAKRLGLHGHRAEAKFIPREYLWSQPSSRLAVLQGLLDTDGYATGPCVEFSTASKQLSDEVVFLVRSLGGTATQSREPAHYVKGGARVECLDKHRSVIKLPSTMKPFRLKRKADAYHPVQRQEPFKAIVSVEDAGEGEAVCIRVNAPDSLYVTEGVTLTHNTLMELVWAENVARKTGRPVLILTPLAVAPQTVAEGRKFGIDVFHSKDGSRPPGARVLVVNYERLARFDAAGYAGVVCDESSILKNFGGSTRKRVTRFLSKLPYRLLATATAAPNDYVELGTSSEALGELTHSDMLKRFFAQCDDKKQRREAALQRQAETVAAADPSYYRKLAFRVSQTIGQWRLKHHAVTPFWRWVCSWARACRRPSDLGFADGGFDLPPLEVHDHVIEAPTTPGYLFKQVAVGLYEEKLERKRTLAERCDYVSRLVDHPRPAVVWCQMDEEADRLVQVIPGAAQVSGRTPEATRLELYDAFTAGRLRVLVIKPRIGAWGLNWQHCDHVVTFVSHSYEQQYQAVRRCWRFGQKSPVRVDVVATEGEVRVLANLRDKARRAEALFQGLVSQMRSAERVERENPYTVKEELPKWL